MWGRNQILHFHKPPGERERTLLWADVSSSEEEEEAPAPPEEAPDVQAQPAVEQEEESSQEVEQTGETVAHEPSPQEAEKPESPSKPDQSKEVCTTYSECLEMSNELIEFLCKMPWMSQKALHKLEVYDENHEFSQTCTNYIREHLVNNKQKFRSSALRSRSSRQAQTCAKPTTKAPVARELKLADLLPLPDASPKVDTSFSSPFYYMVCLDHKKAYSSNTNKIWASYQ